MIRYFHVHEAKFERLVTDYYAMFKQSYDKNIFPEPNELLKFQMAEWGIGRVTGGGTFYSNSIYGNQPYQTTRWMKLYLIDRGGGPD